LLAKTGVGVEKLFSGNFTSKIRSQVIECSFSADAEIDRNYCFGSFFNSHRRSHNLVPFVRQTGEGKAQTCAIGMFRQWTSEELSVRQGIMI
jgi:hypothetical protein